MMFMMAVGRPNDGRICSVALIVLVSLSTL